MWCPKDLKLNKFQFCNLPKNSEYFRRIGEVKPNASAFSGDASLPSGSGSVADQMQNFVAFMQSDYGKEVARAAEEFRKQKESEKSDS